MEKINAKIENIYCSFFKPQNEIKKVLIAIHGFAGDKESSTIEKIAISLTKKDILVIAFDLPGHGEDYEKLDLKECYDYIDRVIKYTISSYNRDISFFATSFGGYLLLNYLNNTKIKFNQIILRAPAIYMGQIFSNKILKEHGYTVKDKILNVNNEYTYNIIEGKKDDIANYKENEKFFKNNIKNYNLFYIENADHRFKNQGEVETIVNIVNSII